MFSNLPSGSLRVAFRVYFLVVLALLGLVSQQCSKYAVKLRLTQGKPVGLSRMTGWVRLRDFAVIFFKLHRLPAGAWLGTIMLFASIFSLVADLAVTLLVTNKQVITRCDFGTGLITSPPQTTDNWVFPPPLGYPALVASNAQI
jgi:hypothetical protein